MASSADGCNAEPSEVTDDSCSSVKEDVCTTAKDNLSSDSKKAGDETDTKSHSGGDDDDGEDEDDANFADAVEELVQSTTLDLNRKENVKDGDSVATGKSGELYDKSSQHTNSNTGNDTQAQGDGDKHFKLPDEDEKEFEDAEDGSCPKEENIIIDYEEVLKQKEANMTDEEKQANRDEAQKLKETGNTRFKDSNYQGAIQSYTEALQLCPLSFPKDRSIMYSNRAACKYKLEVHDDAIYDCTKALELHPHYLKALVRRAELYEKVNKLDEALTDYQKIVELDPGNYAARAACMRLPEQIKEKNEKLKEEMMGKLKDLGNMVLRPFGLSTDNFKLQQDPNSGSYSVQFQQNAPPPPAPPSNTQ